MTIAQKPFKISASSEISLENKSYADDIISYGEDGVCMVTSKRTGMMGWAAPSVENTKFNLYKKTSFTKTISLKPKVEGAKYLKAFNNNNKLSFVDASYNKNSKELELQYHEVNQNGVISKTTKLSNISGSSAFLNAPEYVFETFQSPDKKRIASISLYKDEKGPELRLNFTNKSSMLFKTNSMYISLTDENGDLAFKKNVSINAPADCDKITIEDYKVNNAGDIHLLVKQYIKGKKEKNSDGGVNYNLFIYSILNNGSSVKKHPLQTKDYFCSKPTLVVSNTGNIYSSGFLSEKASGKLVGIFTQKLGADYDESQFKITKITNDDIIKYNSKFKYKDDEFSKNFIIDNIVETNDALHITAEYFNVVTRTSSNGATTVTYHFYDILYFEFDQALQLKQIYVIPKYQNSTSPIYLGYKLIFHNDKPYFIFNDNKKNTDKDENEKITGSAGALKNLAAMMVYHNGTSWVRERMFEKEEVEDNVLMTQSVRQFDDKNIFLPFMKKGSYILGKLTFND